jgi:hypothetical protein
MSKHPKAKEPMNWYAAHVVLYVKFKNTVQDRFPVWENVVLIEAKSEDEAFAKAEAWGATEASDDGSFTWEGHAAEWVFAGVRKIVECAFLNGRPSAGEEVSYTEMEVDSEDAVEKLARGEDVAVWIRDRYRAEIDAG